MALVLFSLFLIFNSQSKAEELIFAARPNFMVGDIAADVLKKAYHRLGHTFKTIEFPAKRALVEANSGRVDGDLARLVHVTKEYTDLRLVPVPVSAILISAFTRNQNVKVLNWEDTKKYHSGVVIGFRYIESRVKNQNHTKTTNALSLYRILQRDRVDIVIDSALRGLDTIKKNGLKGITLLFPPIEKVAEYHVLHKSKEYLIPSLTKVLKEMEQSGGIQKIYDTYIAKLM